MFDTLTSGDDEGIYVWGLNRPKSKNALGKNIFKEILEAFEEIRVVFRVRLLIMDSSMIKTQDALLFVRRVREFFQLVQI